MIDTSSSTGPIVYDVLQDIQKFRNKKGQFLEPENNERRLSILTVPQGIFAALVTGFAPNGTTIDAKLFDPDDLYPEHGAMHIIELYQTIDNKWQVKVRITKPCKNNLFFYKISILLFLYLIF